MKDTRMFDRQLLDKTTSKQNDIARSNLLNRQTFLITRFHCETQGFGCYILRFHGLTSKSYARWTEVIETSNQIPPNIFCTCQAVTLVLEKKFCALCGLQDAAREQNLDYFDVLKMAEWMSDEKLLTNSINKATKVYNDKQI